MSSDEITINLEKRDQLGKRLRGLRSDGLIPVVIHDHGQDSIHASGEKVPLEKVVSSAGRHHPVEVKVGKEARLALIRDIDFDPRKDQIRHVVFQSIRRDQKAHAEIPIDLQGDMPAEHAGLMVLRQLDTVEVEALPTDLPDSIPVDATVLKEVGDHLTVADLRIPKRVTVLTEDTYPVATVEQPKDQLAEADAAAEALAEDAEISGIPEDEDTAEGEGEGDTETEADSEAETTEADDSSAEEKA